ncbi:MAG TPA: hypothetical protein VFE46_12670 [Pirellulales bacterium]|nr:hypothetical protein [Pirellulales bacterium]
MKSGPERQAAKTAATENEPQPIKRIAAIGNGVCEYQLGDRRFTRGGSGWSHFYRPDDEASRRCAILLARSRWKRLPRGVWPTLVDGHLALKAMDKTFPVSLEIVALFDSARAQAVAYLDSLRPAPAGIEHISLQGESVINENTISHKV